MQHKDLKPGTRVRFRESYNSNLDGTILTKTKYDYYGSPRYKFTIELRPELHADFIRKSAEDWGWWSQKGYSLDQWRSIYNYDNSNGTVVIPRVLPDNRETYLITSSEITNVLDENWAVKLTPTQKRVRKQTIIKKLSQQEEKDAILEVANMLEIIGVKTEIINKYAVNPRLKLVKDIHLLKDILKPVYTKQIKELLDD